MTLAAELLTLMATSTLNTNDRVDAFLTGTIQTSLRSFLEMSASLNFSEVRVHIDLAKNPRSINAGSFPTITSLNRSLNEENPTSLTVLNGVGHIWLDEKYQIYTDFQDAICDFIVQLEDEGLTVYARKGATMADLIIDWDGPNDLIWDNNTFLDASERQYLRDAGPHINTETPPYDLTGDGGDDWGT